MSTGNWDAAHATHLFRRLGFGASRARIDRALDEGREATIADLFARRDHDPRLLDGIAPLLSLEKIEPLAAWWMSLILGDRAPLVERVALMWHDHFATSFDKVRDVRLMHRQNQLLRRQGLSDFRQLLHGVARDPAMLMWLDGDQNRRGQPNENFAREVLELFALGRGHYTEDDIQEAARAFTGWGVDKRRFVARERYHDPGEKAFLGASGPFDGDGAVDVILAQPACARHVARRLLAEFAATELSDDIVERWADVLVEREWSIERTLLELVHDPLFDAGMSARRIAGPVELLAITAITLDVDVAPARAADAAAEMGQALFRPPGVKGWDGGRTWIHAGTWLARNRYLTDAASNLKPGVLPEGDPEALLTLLLPDERARALRPAVLALAASCATADEARRRSAALILTAPEYHLV